MPNTALGTASITAVIPCYNAERWLACAIQSVLTQTRRPDEIIVVDDCSVDGSVEVAKRFPVSILHTRKNSGPAAARNLAIQAARCEVIAWLDADDFWDPDHCEVVVGLLDRWREADVAFSSMRFFGSKTGEWDILPGGGTARLVFWESFDATVVPGSAAVTRVDALRAVGGSPEHVRVAPDYALWLRLAHEGPFVWTERVTVNYQWHPAQISSDPWRQRRSMFDSRVRLAREFAQSGEVQLAEQMRERLVAEWTREAWTAWTMVDLQSLRRWVDLGHHLGLHVPPRLSVVARMPAPLVRSGRALAARISAVARRP